ncbi:MAG: DUF4043 family protein [Nitrospira sp.]|nr:DUF4043 family protein [Nitrospira sp.]
MSFESILTTHGSTVERWESEIMYEWLRQSFWSKFMGDSENAIIQLKADLTKNAGDALTIQIASEVQGGVVTGSSKVQGNEGRMDFYAQRLTCDNDNVSVRMDNIPMQQQRVSFDVLRAARTGLTRKRRIRTDDRINAALSVTSTGRVRGRYLYGAADSNWNATHATALQNVDNAADQQTLAMIDMCKRKAQTPLNATAKVRPMMSVENDSGKGFQEWYMCVLHPLASRDLTQNDAKWAQPQLLLPTTSNPNNPLYTGSSFKGGYNGVLIYEWEGIELLSSTIQVAHNLFVGAQAAALVWAQYSKFKEQDYNYGEDMGFKLHEINGIEKLIFDRNAVDSTISNEDNGVLHMFSAAVAD